LRRENYVRKTIGLCPVNSRAGALGLLPAAQAQEGPKPEAVGLRPDAPPYAVHGPYWVGVMEFKAETGFHPTTVAVWYPALNPDGHPEKETYFQVHRASNAPMPWQGHAISDASPDGSGGPYPLVIFAHGLFMARFTSAYLVEHLASYGFVVMAIEYADDFETARLADPDLSMYTRPKDVSWQIGYADELTGAGNTLEGMIDAQQVAVVGHSYGGNTALMAGGAQLDFNGPTSMCVQYADQTFVTDSRPEHVVCADTVRKLVNLTKLDTAPEGLWPSWGDPRVDAIVPLAPDIMSFGADSLKNITVPTMIMVGSRDQLILSDLPLYKPYLYDSLGSTSKSMVVFDNADHGIFTDTCAVAPWMIEWGVFSLCSDPVWDMDRAHDLINHFTTAFLLAALKGDTDAAAALAPDAVSFPGIEYQTTGF
jgi:predicted dienelactone hydrolase